MAGSPFFFKIEYLARKCDRLRLEIVGLFLRGQFEVLIADDVVALEDAAGLAVANFLVSFKCVGTGRVFENVNRKSYHRHAMRREPR
jgi:hypothetical protein